MSLLKEIHANAAVAWSPVRRRAELLALGSKGDGGVAFENTGGEFKLVSMDFSDPSTNMLTLGAVKTPSRFTTLAWRDVAKHHDTCPYGIVAGGMADGTVTLWNPKAMIDREEAGDAPVEIARITRHKGAVNALQFNPHEDSSHLLASGGSDGEVYIVSLDKLSAPAVFTPSGGSLAQQQQQVNEITSVAWNTQKKPWCELRDPQRGAISAIAWNPNEGLQIATASGDDQRPVIKLWDLRNSTSTPLAEFHDHSAGVLSMSWCPNDPGLILSCGKDNRTLLWDLYTRRTVFEFPSDHSHAPTLGSDQFFGGGAGQRRWNVQWAPKIPAVASACTLDGKVQVWGLSGGGNPEVRPPRWARRPCGASFGFGGKLVTIANPREPAGPNTDRRRLIHVHRFASEAALVAEAEDLDRALESKDFKGHCERKIAGAHTEKEQSIWSFMKILFEKDARQHLLLHLGLDAEKISQLNQKFCPQAPEPTQQHVAQPEDLLNERIDSSLGAEDVFASGLHQQSPSPPEQPSPLNDVASISSSLPEIDDTSRRLEVTPTPLYTEQSESTLMQALLVGNFEVAVNCCLHYNQLADALLLASCGGPELWEKTQRAFFAHQTRPVMRVVSAIIKNELTGLVETSDLAEWRQTLAILSTYAKSEEFPSLCDKLASRLEGAGDLHSATLCYMCAVNVEKTVAAWVKESEIEAKIRGHKIALQRLVEKVSIFSQAVDQSDQLMGPEIASRFAEYSSLMAAQGRLDIAAKYARFSDISCAILRDRIYNAAPVPGYQPPPFPFDMVNVVAVAAQQPQHQQTQGYGKQSYGNRGQYAAQGQATAQFGAQPQAAAGFGAPQPVGYGAPAPTPTPAYPGQQAGPGYGNAQPAGQYQQPQQARVPNPGMYNRTPSGGLQQPGYPPAPQNAGYNAPTQPQHPSYPGQQPSYGAHPTPAAQPSYPGQTPQGFGGSQPTGYSPAAPQPPQPQGFAGASAGFNRPAQPSYPGQPSPGFSGPPSTGSMSAGYGTPGVGFSAPPAVPTPPQAPGINPLTAQTSLASSRIAKPSVDMNAQKKDGFVTSVGNKELTLKYGNATTAALSPMAAPQQPAPTFENVVPGSTENVSAQDMPIVNAFNELVAQLGGLPLTMMEQKQLTEIQKSKEVLFTKLNIGDLSPAVVARLHEMVACFAQRDFATAQSIYVALTGSDWAQHKDWLRGLKSLIHISMKRFR
ncbi:hypothetical protein PINS_up003539 [Pythium insidiosum]|nr:hypothetical protein PINS_up003539 [Pythium insidiosum]